jgi:hypothetical protein
MDRNEIQNCQDRVLAHQVRFYNCPFTLKLYWGRRIIQLCKN